MSVSIAILALSGLLGLGGIGGAVESAENNQEAERLIKEAKLKFYSKKVEANFIKDKTNKGLKELGELKLRIWDEKYSRLTSLFEKVINVECTEKVYIDGELPNKNSFSRSQLREMKQLSLKAKEVVAGGAGALGAGALAGVAAYGGAMMFASASTGTAIATLSGAAATNATLAWFGGGSIAAGGVGMAGGVAVLGGIITGPILLVGGAILAGKAAENLAEARKVYAKAQKDIEEMNNAITMLDGIYKLCEMYRENIYKLSMKITEAMDKLEDCIRSKQNPHYSKDDIKVDYRTFNREEREIFQLTYLIAETLKILLETPLLTKDGAIDNNAKIKLVSAQEIINK